MQKVQAVNADFSPYVDANANPTLHQMVTQMISDKVQVEVNEEDQPVTDVAGARNLAGFDVLLLGARKDAPTLVVGGSTLSGVVIRMTLEFRIWWVGASKGWPAPIARTAARAVEMDRPVTPPTRQPSSCKRRPRARPTRPPPMMDTVSGIRCVSIL